MSLFICDPPLPHTLHSDPMLLVSTDNGGIVQLDDPAMIRLDGRGAIQNHHLQMLRLEHAKRGSLCYSGGQQHCEGGLFA
jgi:hypothetical protein